jgi:hypothetical protein
VATLARQRHLVRVRVRLGVRLGLRLGLRLRLRLRPRLRLRLRLRHRLRLRLRLRPASVTVEHDQVQPLRPDSCAQSPPDLVRVGVKDLG